MMSGTILRTRWNKKGKYNTSKPWMKGVFYYNSIILMSETILQMRWNKKAKYNTCKPWIKGVFYYSPIILMTSTILSTRWNKKVKNHLKAIQINQTWSICMIKSFATIPIFWTNYLRGINVESPVFRWKSPTYVNRFPWRNNQNNQNYSVDIWN